MLVSGLFFARRQLQVETVFPDYPHDFAGFRLDHERAVRCQVEIKGEFGVAENFYQHFRHIVEIVLFRHEQEGTGLATAAVNVALHGLFPPLLAGHDGCLADAVQFDGMGDRATIHAFFQQDLSAG